MYDSDEDASFVVLTPPAAMMYHQVQFNQSNIISMIYMKVICGGVYYLISFI